jgi:hypothetical protein
MRTSAKHLTSITGRKFLVSANFSKRSFTIKTESAKYRTYKLSKSEFDSCLSNTGNDWANFLKTDDYFKVK